MQKGIIFRLIVGIISVFVGIVLQLPSISHAAEFLNSPRAKFTGTVGFPPLPPSQPQPSIKPVAVSLQGKYDSGYSNESNFSTIQGSITINNGTVTIENIILQ